MKSLRGLKIFQCEMLPLRMEIGRRARGEMEGREEITVPEMELKFRNHVQKTGVTRSFVYDMYYFPSPAITNYWKLALKQ